MAHLSRWSCPAAACPARRPACSGRCPTRTRCCSHRCPADGLRGRRHLVSTAFALCQCGDAAESAVIRSGSQPADAGPRPAAARQQERPPSTQGFRTPRCCREVPRHRRRDCLRELRHGLRAVRGDQEAQLLRQRVLQAHRQRDVCVPPVQTRCRGWIGSSSSWRLGPSPAAVSAGVLTRHSPGRGDGVADDTPCRAAQLCNTLQRLLRCSADDAGQPCPYCTLHALTAFALRLRRGHVYARDSSQGAAFAWHLQARHLLNTSSQGPLESGLACSQVMSEGCIQQ